MWVGETSLAARRLLSYRIAGTTLLQALDYLIILGSFTGRQQIH